MLTGATEAPGAVFNFLLMSTLHQGLLPDSQTTHRADQENGKVVLE